MFSAKTYTARRNELCKRIGKGIILIPANMPSPNNFPNNSYYFRQDSTFRYFFGLNTPALFGVIDAESGDALLFGNDFTIDDIIWTGPQPTVKDMGAEVGVTATFALPELEKVVRKAISEGRRVHYLPPYRGEIKLQLSALLGIKPELLHDYKSVDLMFAIAEMREIKSQEEIDALERAFPLGYKMHTTAMRMCRPGVIEQTISGTIEGVARAFGQGVSFPSIVSQHGETLHNLRSDGVLESGRMLLVDAGAESLEGYCTDHTRTYPVNGKFSDRQKDVYNAVLTAHDNVQAMVKPYIRFTEIHKTALLSLADSLKGIGIVKGSAEDAVAAGAIDMVMPHGLGHGMGMDVHDCEVMGERSFSFADIIDRAAKSETCVYRQGWVVKPGTVMTDEPGLYFIPALIDKCRAEGKYTDFINYDVLEGFKDFGGIRIEDDLLVTETGNRYIGDKRIPYSVEDLEAIVGKDE